MCNIKFLAKNVQFHLITSVKHFLINHVVLHLINLINKTINVRDIYF